MGPRGTPGRPPTRLVALDLDGTVIDRDGALSERVREAVQAVERSGREIVIATGRSVVATLPVLDQLGLLHGYAVTSNGAVTIQLDPTLPDGYEVVDAVVFDPAPALRVLREHLPNAVYAVEDLGLGFRLTAPFPDGELIGEMTVTPFENLLSEPVTRVVVRSPEHTPEQFLDIVERLGLHGGSYTVGWTAWLDIAPEGVSKAHGLELVAARLGIDATEVLAVGDGRNDLEMFAWAGHAVAMGQAPVEVAEAADAVVATVDEDGLADVLEPLVGLDDPAPAAGRSEDDDEQPHA
jgi:hydroxymethylpyrimidine pyrophosphatase-like HAD family hydrolase